jgi:hypothetical protein
MINIKESAPYDLKASMCSSAYGADHQARISRDTARKLCGMYPLPAPGVETVVAFNAVPYRRRLCVQNLGGWFYVASVDAKAEQWPEVFGVTLVRK